MSPFILPFSAITLKDVAAVGGKNASLGEMIHALTKEKVRVPDGFAITADAYTGFLKHHHLQKVLQAELDTLNTKTLENLGTVSSNCRNQILKHNLPDQLRIQITSAYQRLAAAYAGSTYAVRSSATCEDSPTASFAGQHDSFLNVEGVEEVLGAVLKCYASLFNERAIKYRIDNGFNHMQVAQSVGVQRMIRSDRGSAGVAFTIEPETGNDNLVYITGAWGLGESVVQGAVNTDEFYFFKPAIRSGKDGFVIRHLGTKQRMMIYGEDGMATQWQETPAAMRDQFVLEPSELALLAKWCVDIEKHYALPMDIEWAKDGITGEVFIVQARPETVHTKDKKLTLKEFQLKSKAKPVLTGKSVGYGIVSGRVCIVRSLADAAKVLQGDIIVTDITNPDWNALLKRAICIVTNKGGRTSHASIIARELGIPAVVGTLTATDVLTDGKIITVSCASGDEGMVFEGKLDWEEKAVAIEGLSHTRTLPMFILSDPGKALICATYPSQGVGLLRMEFSITNALQVHPMALVKFDEIADGPEKKQIQALTRHYTDKKKYFIDNLASSIGMVAAAFFPREVIVRMSDFKTNEYAKLLGGRPFEPEEENPMLGFRGASRYYHDRYREGFALECAAILRIREEMGLTNVKVMIPFCRTVEEGKRVLEVMKTCGLERGKNGLEVYVMAEIPSNILLAEDFAGIFDGFSIGSNDLTQLTLGLDRDSAIVSGLFDESNPAVTQQIRHLVKVAHVHGVKVGLCGQAPSDHPDFASFLVNCGIDSISFNQDALLKGIGNIVVAEKEFTSKQLK